MTLACNLAAKMWGSTAEQWDVAEHVVSRYCRVSSTRGKECWPDLFRSSVHFRPERPLECRSDTFQQQRWLPVKQQIPLSSSLESDLDVLLICYVGGQCCAGRTNPVPLSPRLLRFRSGEYEG